MILREAVIHSGMQVAESISILSLPKSKRSMSFVKL